MDKRFLASVRAMAAMAAVFGLSAAVTLAGQEQPPAGGPDWAPPLTADGQPAIQGSWRQRSGITTYSIQAGFADRDEHTRIGGQRPAMGQPIMTPDKKIPYLPWAATFADFLHEQHYGAWTPAYLDPVSRGMIEGVPRIHYQSRTEIYQFPTQIVIVSEYGHHYRVIPIDGRPFIPSNIKLWMGDSRARWEGNTLVVDVKNSNDQTWFDIVGSFHSDEMVLEERWTFSGPERIDYIVTITDPAVFREPWKIGMVLAKVPYAEMWPSEIWEGQTITDATSLSVRPPQ
jgi:hypothetical protein